LKFATFHKLKTYLSTQSRNSVYNEIEFNTRQVQNTIKTGIAGVIALWQTEVILIN